MHTPAAFTCTRTSPRLRALLLQVEDLQRLVDFGQHGGAHGVLPQAGSYCELDELGRNGGRQPYTIRRAKEDWLLSPHSPGMTRKTTGRPCRRPTLMAVASSGDRCTCWRSPRLKPLGADCGHRRDGRAVEQDGRRLGRLQAEVDLDGVALIGADAFACRVEREALLVAGRRDLGDQFASEGDAVCARPRDERIDVRPAIGVQRQADASGWWRSTRLRNLLLGFCLASCHSPLSCRFVKRDMRVPSTAS